MRRCLAIITTSFLFLSSCSFAGGGDIDYTPVYETIRTVDDLVAISGSGRNYKLQNDIDLTGYGNWSPIKNFIGELNGDNYSIIGLTISGTSVSNQGLFASLGSYTVVKNLKINASFDLKGECTNIGIVAGSNSGSIENVTTTGTINAEFSTCVGGIAGYSTKYINNSKNKANINGYKRVGGIVGEYKYTSDGQLSGNSNEGNIIAKNNSIGGIIGYAHGDYGSTSEYYYTTIKSNSNYGNIYSDGLNVGGIVGYCDSEQSFYGYRSILTIASSVNSGNIEGSSNVGGILGYATAVNQINTSENHGSVTARGNYVGGYVGYGEGVNVSYATNNSKISGNGYVGGIAGLAKSITHCENTGEIESLSATLEDQNLIACVGGIAGVVSSAENCINKSNIVISHNGNKVGGIVGEYRYSSNTNLTNCTNEGTISAKGNSVGGIIGLAQGKYGSSSEHYYSKLENNINKGDIESPGDCVGGIIGASVSDKSFYSSYSFLNITSCQNNGAIKGNSFVGGMVGDGNYVVTITACENNNDVTGGGNYIGGYLGRSERAVLKYLTNTNNVSGNAYLGGIAGTAKSLENCENSGKITCAGGILDGTYTYLLVGGIVGSCRFIKNCINRGLFDFKTSGTKVGGIAGELIITAEATIEGNKNYSSITVNSSTQAALGGIVGYLRVENGSSSSNFNLIFSNNYNEGNLSSNGNGVGGIVGLCSSVSTSIYNRIGITSFTNCTNVGNVSGFHYAGGILGYGEHINSDENVWATNTQTGIIEGNPSDSGNMYGLINP